MLVYPSGLDLSSSALRFLTVGLREHRHVLGTRWRRLSAGRQALLALSHLRNGHPYAQLAAGFGIGTTTAYRCITEAVELLASLTPTLAEAAWAASTKAYVLLEGTLLPIDRIARQPALLSRQAQETPDERAGHRRPLLGRHGIPRSRRHGPCPLLGLVGDPGHRPAGGQSFPRHDPGPRRTGHRHPQVLAAPA